MRRAVLFTIIAGLVPLASGLSAQKLGQVFLSITSPDGKRVEGIRPEDVLITEDGVSCRTTAVEAVDLPTRLQVLVSIGKSNTNPVSPLREGLKGFFEQIPDGVEMSIYTTNGTPRSLVKPTTDKQKVFTAISLLGPDNNACMFFDSLFEASERAVKEKAPGYPMIVTIGSDFTSLMPRPSDFKKLQTNLYDRGIKTHVLLNVFGQGETPGGAQIDIGIHAAKITGGRYESFNSETRLATLLPEVGKDVARSIALQSHQYRVTYEPCSTSQNENGVSIGASVRGESAVKLSLHGPQ